jgi:hypothetical protein
MKILSGSVQPTYAVGSKSAERAIYFTMGEGQAFAGVTAATSMTSTMVIFDISASTMIRGRDFIESGRSGMLMASLYTTGSTGSLSIMRYYTGTTSTWVVQLVTSSRSVEGRETVFVPIKSSEAIGFSVTATTAAATGYMLSVSECGLPYPRV